MAHFNSRQNDNLSNNDIASQGQKCNFNKLL